MPYRLIQHLSHLGLSKKEVDIYTYLLSVDSAFPTEISKELKIKRPTTYVILDLLKEKGLIREVQKGKRTSYEAEDPERIKFLLEKRKIETEEHLYTLSQTIPRLKAIIRKRGLAPIIKFYEGEKAVRESMEELAGNPDFREKTDYGVFSLELIYELFKHEHLREYIDFRITKNKFLNAVYTSDEGIVRVSDDSIAVRIDNKEFPITCDISIFQDEVRFHMLGKTIYGIMIKNPELAETLTSLIRLVIKNNK